MSHRIAFRILAGLLGVGLCCVASARAAEHTTDTLETVRDKVAKGEAVLVDVRERKEWDAGHLRDAKLAPLSRLAQTESLKEIVQTLPKGKPIYLHCKSGGRCLVAADALKDEGFDLRPLKAGFEELLEAGFPKAEK